MPNQVETCQECGGSGTTYISCCGVDIKGTTYADIDICPKCKATQDGPSECVNCEGAGMIEIPRYNTRPIGVEGTIVEWEHGEEDYDFIVCMRKCYTFDDSGLWVDIKEYTKDIVRVSASFKISTDPEFIPHCGTPVNISMSMTKYSDKINNYEGVTIIKAMYDLCEVVDLTKIPYMTTTDTRHN